MRTLFEFFKLFRSESGNLSHQAKYFAQNFHESQNSVEIKEDSQDETWLNKGYALGQGVCHASTKQDIECVLSEINSICETGKKEKDVAEKINLLFLAIQETTRVYKGFAELSQYTINSCAVAALLSDDLRKVITSEVSKIEKNRR